MHILQIYEQWELQTRSNCWPSRLFSSKVSNISNGMSVKHCSFNVWQSCSCCLTAMATTDKFVAIDHKCWPVHLERLKRIFKGGIQQLFLQPHGCWWRLLCCWDPASCLQALLPTQQGQMISNACSSPRTVTNSKLAMSLSMFPCKAFGASNWASLCSWETGTPSLLTFLAMATSLRSNQWSCSELERGATICADMAGMDLRVNPSTLSKDELVQAIQDPA